MKTKTLYKITTTDNTTRNNTKWGVNTTHSIPPTKNPKLCSDQVLHAYSNLNLAIFLNPIHGNYQPFNIWKAKGTIVVEDWGKVGCFELTTLEQLPIPEWYSNKDTRWGVWLQFGILCAEEVLSIWQAEYPEDDRPAKAIQAAKNYLTNPSKENARAAARAAAWAVDAAARAVAARAAEAAARAAEAVAEAVAEAARAAARAAWAAEAARAARAAEANINFGELADRAVKLVMSREGNE